MTEFTTPGGAQPGARSVRCAKLGRELPGLSTRPFPNDLGQRIYDQISQEAWGLWLAQSRMIVNEYRLNLSTPDARRFLLEQCEKFLFGEGTAPPPDTTPPVIEVPATVVLDCTADYGTNVTGTASAQDACGTVSLTYSDVVTNTCGNAVPDASGAASTICGLCRLGAE